MPDDGSLDLRADPPRPSWSRADLGCGLLLALGFGSCAVCIVAPTERGSLDQLNVEASRIVLAKLAERLAAGPVTPDTFRTFAGEQADDAWGNAVQYTASCDGGTWRYRLASLGKDGRPGGEGVDADLATEGPHTPLACPPAR